MENMRLEPGTILAEKYRLENVLGVGGMGTVYRAEHLALKAPVAIKIIDREVTDGDLTMARFMREAQAAASLRSPHVVQILDYGTEGDRPFMVMEMLEGEPLSDRIERYGHLTPSETFRVINHVAKAVARAHEADIVHRDLKPDNVFLVHNEGDEIAKVLDFGVAKIEATQLDGSGHTRTGSLLGTPYYMSPEQAQGNKHIDARSDLWALGVIAFECLLGRRPFSSDGLGDLVLQICIRDIPVPSQVGDVPEGFDAWFQRACAREPDDRFQTARELAEALYKALGLAETNPHAESRWSRGLSFKERDGLAQRDARTLAEGGTPDPDDSDPSQRPTQALQAEVARALSVEARASAVTLALPSQLADQEPGFASSGFSGDSPAPPVPSNPASSRPSNLQPRSSRWEVVPHDSADVADEEDRVSDPLAPIPKKGGGTLAFVALLALLVGGAAVFGVRAAGLLDAPASPERPVPSVIPPAAEPEAVAEPDDGNVPVDATPQKARKAGGNLGDGQKEAPKAALPAEGSEELKALEQELERAFSDPAGLEDPSARPEPASGDAPGAGPEDTKPRATEPPQQPTPPGDSKSGPAPNAAPPSRAEPPVDGGARDSENAPPETPTPAPEQPKAAPEEPQPTPPAHLVPGSAPVAPPAPVPAPQDS